MQKTISRIYKITNIVNNQCYIGQAVNIKKRWREHRSDAFNKNCKDYNMVIYKAIRKHGLENFTFEILEECSQDLLNEKEVYWIAYFNSYYNGYNCTLGGDESHIHLGKPVELYDKEGNFVIEYPNIATAARALDVFYGTLYQVIQGKRHSCKGYQAKLKEDDVLITRYKNKQGGKIPVLQKDDNGNILNEFESSYEAARQLGLDASTIIKCCNRKLKHCGGYRWERK